MCHKRMAVAAVGEPSLDSILQARALSREKLRVVCPIEVCNQLALKLTSWKELCPFIGLSELDETEIEEDYRKHRERKIGKLGFVMKQRYTQIECPTHHDHNHAH